MALCASGFHVFAWWGILMCPLIVMTVAAVGCFIVGQVDMAGFAVEVGMDLVEAEAGDDVAEVAGFPSGVAGDTFAADLADAAAGRVAGAAMEVAVVASERPAG